MPRRTRLNPGYDRDVVVNCLDRHYQLLERMGYLPPSSVERPPSNGWSDAQLHVDMLRATSRSEKVIDLLRHIPYLKKQDTSIDIEIYVGTFPLRYLREACSVTDDSNDAAAKPLLDLGLMPFDGTVPPQMISLTHGNNGVWWLVDTENGYIFPHGPEYDSCSDEELHNNEPWRAQKPVGVQAYFEGIYSEISSLNVVPAPRSAKWQARIVEKHCAEGKEVTRLYREYGWPNAFRQEAFVQAVETSRAELIQQTIRDRKEEDDWEDVDSDD